MDLDSTFANLVYLARTKLEREMDDADRNRFSFSKVVDFATLKPVSACLDKSLIRHRAYFEFELDHAQGADWFPLMVEAMLLVSPDDSERIASLVLCTLEEPGRALVFPAFRYRDLRIYSMSAPFSTSPSGTVNRFFTLTNSAKDKFTLRCPDDDQFLHWKAQLEDLFPHEEEWNVSVMTEAEDDMFMSGDGNGNVSCDTSCYSFGSKCEDILSQSMHGLNIINTGSISSKLSDINATHLLEKPPLTFVGYNLSPQLDQVQPTPSLIEDNDLKSFLTEDFDFSSSSLVDAPAPLSAKKRPLSMLEITAAKSPSLDLPADEPTPAATPTGPTEHQPSFVIIGDNESTSSFISFSESMEAESILRQAIKDEGEDNNDEDEFDISTDSIVSLHIPSAAVLPMKFPPCPPTPDEAVFPIHKNEPEPEQQPAPAPVTSANVSSPLTPKLGTVPAMVLKYEASCESLREEAAKQNLEKAAVAAAPPGTPKTPTLKRKASTGSRLVSAFRSISTRLKTKPSLPSIAPIDEDEESNDVSFEMLDTTPRMKQVNSFDETYNQLQQQQQAPVARVNRGNPLRASRALSKISEEVILDDLYEEECDDEQADQVSTGPTPSELGRAYFGQMLRASSSTNSLTNSASFHSFEKRASAIIAAATASSHHTHDYSVGTAISVESNNETVQSGHSRTFSNAVSLDSFRRENSSSSVSSYGSKYTASKAGTDATLVNSSEETNHHKAYSTSSSQSSAASVLLRVPTAMVSKWNMSVWKPVSEIPLTVVVKAGGLISCHMPLSGSQSSLSTVYEDADADDESGSPLGKVVFQLPVNAGTHVRKRSVYDVHVRHDSDVYLFRLQSSVMAVEFAHKVDLARQCGSNSSRSGSVASESSSTSSNDHYTGAVAPRPTANKTRNGLTLNLPPLLHRRNSDYPVSPVSPMGSVHSLPFRFGGAAAAASAPVLPLSRNSSYTSTPNNSTDTLRLQQQQQQQVQRPEYSIETLVLSNLRCRIFVRAPATATTADSPMASQWLERGLARIKVSTFSTPATAHSADGPMRKITLLKPAADEILIDARLPAACFECAGPVGLKISEPGKQAQGVSKYLLRMRSALERDQLAAALGCQ